VQLRWRCTWDSSVTKDGWYVDDVCVQTCVATEEIFADGFDPTTP
jgi:hypothetical protein